MAARSGRGLLLLTAVLLGFLQASSTFEVTEDGKICILANFSVQFTVDYNNTKSQKQNASIELPDNATVLRSNSSCGGKDKSPILAIGFGKGHSLHLEFGKSGGFYNVTSLTFKYNLSDTTIFRDPTEKGMKEATSDPDIHAGLNTSYTCVHSHRLKMANVTVLFTNVKLEAYLASNNFSHDHTLCKEDQVPTTPSTPTTTPTTTTQAPPTPSKKPDKGQYNVTGHSGTCLFASMGLQLNVTYSTKNKTKSDILMNIPLNTTYNGTCNNASVTLNLFLERAMLGFRFVQNASIDKYFLQGINIIIFLPSEAVESKYNVTNNSLSELKATVGKSFKCIAEENIWVSDNASVNLFDVQLQAFKFEGDKFGAVEECQLDENNMLIPIIVGAALAGLVLIVLIAYLIGRKRSHAGYQTI
uniref:lysosome-associated membrane glycoprotein 1 n=1 Tax=Euleptes europaea TaxID=460621 RepID=UPI0025404D59|nr:lysosome-associated membrane glycoprotein 1 [Euleptes europaea]